MNLSCKKSLVILLIVTTFQLFTAAQQKIREVTFVDGENREYYVHIPASYDGLQAVPMVFMLHGTGGDGDVMYVNSGWVELAEKEGFIAVFPSSLRYKIFDHDGNKTTTKWNTTPDTEFIFQPGETGKDDIKFLRIVLSEVAAQYNIDLTRVYLNGFSNGGQMAAKCSIEMGDVLAAVCSNASSFYLDTFYTPRRKLPYLFQVGNRDYGPGNAGPDFPQVPMHLFDTLISTPGLPYQYGKHYKIANNVVRNFSLQSQHGPIVGDTNFAVFTTYLPLDLNDHHEFRFVFVKDLGHSYPNWAPEEHWKWLRQYTLDGVVADQYRLIVEGGYGSGYYFPGDTVPIWSDVTLSDTVFLGWTGDTSFVLNSLNYHTNVVMPEGPVHLTSSKGMLQGNIFQGQVMINGVNDIPVEVTYRIPSQAEGLIWLFNGGNTKGGDWFYNIEKWQATQQMLYKKYALITFDNYDKASNTDLNGNGEMDFNYATDTLTNPDLANTQRIRNKLIALGLLGQDTPEFSVGFSSGAYFSELSSVYFKRKASVCHNYDGIDALSTKSLTPTFHVNSARDTGDGNRNVEAMINFQNYQDRQICSEFVIQKPQPIYPQKFARIPGISLSRSNELFDSLQARVLDDENYLTTNPITLQSLYESHPNLFASFFHVLNSYQIGQFFTLLHTAYAGHAYNMDWNLNNLNFIETRCGESSGTQSIDNSTEIVVFPNPSEAIFRFSTYVNHFEVRNAKGTLIYTGDGIEVNLSNQPSGLYFLFVKDEVLKLIKI